MKTKVFLILLAVIFSSCSKAPRSDLSTLPAPAIINGETVSKDEAIWNSIVRVGNRTGQCTGTLIAEDKVLTAAHCVDLNPMKIFYVSFFGGPENSEYQECRDVAVQKVEYDPNSIVGSDGVHKPDLAVLHLTKPVCNVVVAELASPAQTADAVGSNIGPDEFLSAGFGLGTKSPSAPDRIAIQKISSDKKTIDDLYSDLDSSNANEKPYLDFINSRIVDIAKNYSFGLPIQSERSTCIGDSGGPVYREKDGKAIIYAVNGMAIPHIKKGAKNCAYAYLQAFTEVNSGITWIYRNK